MITNDQMIAQILNNLRDLNNQISINLTTLSSLDDMYSESHGGPLNLHDQIIHLRNGQQTITNGLNSAHGVHGVDVEGNSI